MKIEVNKSQGFKTSIIVLFESDQKAVDDFKSIAGKWASMMQNAKCGDKYSHIATMAVSAADALIAELNKKKDNV